MTVAGPHYNHPAVADDTDDDTCARPTAPRTIIIRTGILDAVDTAHKHCESAGFIHTFHTTARASALATKQDLKQVRNAKKE